MAASREGISQIEWMYQNSGEEYNNFWNAVKSYSKYNKKAIPHKNFDDLIKKKGKLIKKLSP